MACDICGKTENKSLELLKDEYSTKDIKQLCPECMKQTNDVLWKVRSFTSKLNKTLTQKFMITLKEKFDKERPS